MFGGITWSKVSTKRIDAVTRNYREKILPSLRTQTGFLGGIVLADRTNGEGVAASYWQTAEAMSASEEMATAGRAEAIKTAGSDMEITEVDRFEIILQDRPAPVQVRTFLRSKHLRG